MITFPEWCRACVRIKDKTSGNEIPFVLNAPQRRIARILEADRQAGRQSRLIILKARQWGASTLIQAYIAYMQLVVCRNWHAVICAHNMNTAATLRAVYSKILENYPQEHCEEDVRPRFRRYEGSSKTLLIDTRGSKVIITSAGTPNAVRGNDIAMAHLSEVAFWPDTPRRSPEDVFTDIQSGIANSANTLIVLESTANGVGNFFHRMWVDNVESGAFRTIFVPWYENDACRLPLDADEAETFSQSLSSYETGLRDVYGCTLEQIKWYREKLSALKSHQRMMAEFPTTPDEAFVCSGTPLFDPSAIALLRADCRPPVQQGIVRQAPEPREEVRMRPRPVGQRGVYPYGRMSLAQKIHVPDVVDESFAIPALDIWQHPLEGASYITAVDIGGRSDRADYSVIAVMRRDSARPEVVAQWRGHIDHDILADYARNIAGYYNHSLLVVESNSLEQPGQKQFVLQRLKKEYDNLYARSNGLPGFHTNTSTKHLIITHLIAAVRDHAYIERDSRACDELAVYQQLANGAYSAPAGAHDDILITRAIALHLAGG